uniref:Uncharacterized protein n=1 Tax=Aegilops tauschii subsp. strangulata TaxID=200361 RepID=A0A453RK11_AEGTS
YPCVTANQVFSFLSFAEALYELFSACNYTRKIIVFVKGLDFCGGRYDTPRHPLY